MHHAARLIARIIFLDGNPNLQKLDSLRIGWTLRKTLECDLAVEHDARTLFIGARRHCDEVGDYMTHTPFAELIADEEGHIDFLETQIGPFDRLGEPIYGQLNPKSAEEAE